MRIAAPLVAACTLVAAVACAPGRDARTTPAPTRTPAPTPALTSVPAPTSTSALASRSPGAPTPGPVATPAVTGAGWRYAYVSDRPDTRLTDLAAAGPREAWAAGSAAGELLLLRHDGTAWRPAEPPPGRIRVPPGADVRVAASGPADVWLLLPEIGADEQVEALSAVRWDGSAWHRVPGRIDAPAVADFAVLGPADAWAVHGAGRPLATHWDGRSWTDVPLPGDAEAAALSGTGPADLWAVGARHSGRGVTGSELSQPAAMHWDGRSWRLVPTPEYAFAAPKPPEGSAGLEGVLALSPTDVWAIGTHTFNHGEAADEPADPPPILLHWDGRAWSRHTAPKAGYCCPRLAESPSGGGVLVVTGSPRLRDTWRMAAPGGPAARLPRLPAIPGLKRSQFFTAAGLARSGTVTWAAGTLEADGGFWRRAAIAAAG
ncbi:hypothetical protein MF672_006425 [Actinomadura sp. ATCC 31491]|uniref:Exo-alpha-sialidase n=1 Tax=Actinomadura luzonensis TaxID=2805427 RepID=A0ABT0FM66_9ACTN|nr:hypothetical protein [Actinomadura luzonensis]MCK2213429.1 hypothetical protein [Actinomadura luzonensis]